MTERWVKGLEVRVCGREIVFEVGAALEWCREGL